MPIDGLVALNLAIAGVMAILFYYQHYRRHVLAANLGEFLLYAAITLAVTVAGWWRARRLDLGWAPLVSLQALMVLHFAGGVVARDGIRLYDVPVAFGVSFDKVVHFAAGFVAVQLFTALARGRHRDLPPFPAVFAVLVALGGGAAWELVEYLAYALIPLTGVGGYDNNMQDLLANGLGAVLFVAQPRRWQDVEAGLSGAGVRAGRPTRAGAG
ncbi:MAG TPA: DUF2238 domain-containing protein [Thermoanaerobaculaceae bacterium]|nr:DUF2238 domain-containing protein [Thermoanaerobaculaceae bacterium]HRS15447.1 DUF2238 domain-containing protein [Thermoanaerobaculaceae bacterium]